jgi:uncharacterized protein
VINRPFSRRNVLRGAAVSVAAAATLPASSAARAAAAAAAARSDTGVSAFAFPLSAVTLLDSPFRANMARTQSYLTFLEADRLLHTFRTNVGLPSSAAACGGWEAPGVELRGHSIGHVMSGLALSYANTGDAGHKSKLDYLVTELAKCQARAGAVGFRTGYLSAYPESFIDRVEARQSVWAPYYTLHKIYAGLLDAHLLAGNAQALTVVSGMAAWAKSRMDRLSYAQQQGTLTNEFGGMNEVLINLYQVTGDPNHLAVAKQFDHAEIYDPLASNIDRLAGYHANTQIPKMTGAIREYHATGTTRYRDIAVNFWNMVTGQHSYVIGGNSNSEHFAAPGRIAAELSDRTCESCNTYNMLKLTRQLFFTDPSRGPAYLDYYERALYNHILGQQDPRSTHGFVSYFIPLRAGGIKTYSNDYNDFTCCHGTGMESNTKYADTIYAYNADDLYVNLFIPSELRWPGRGITIRQETTYPQSTTTRLTVTGGSGPIRMRLRIPSWTSGATLTVNGADQPAPTTGTYAVIDRTWSTGDVVQLTLPMTLRTERTPDNPAVQAACYGPVVLAGAYGSNNLSALPTLDAASIKATSTPLQFTANASTGAVTLLPFYNVHGQRYTVYWNVTSVPPPPPLVAHYRFDESSGTSAADASGNGKVATLSGSTSWTTGRVGGAVNLSGNGGYVSLPAGLLVGATAGTVAAWVRINTLSTWSRVFDLGSGTGTNMFLTPRSDTGAARFAITTGGAGAEQRINAPSALPTGAWTHVAVTLSGTAGVLYVNGTEVARNASLTLQPGALGSTTQNWVGRSQYSGDPYLNAAVDDLRLYSRALAASEIAQLAAG